MSNKMKEPAEAKRMLHDIFMAWPEQASSKLALEHKHNTHTYTLELTQKVETGNIKIETWTKHKKSKNLKKIKKKCHS